jgi:hypothetical protein
MDNMCVAMERTYLSVIARRPETEMPAMEISDAEAVASGQESDVVIEL